MGERHAGQELFIFILELLYIFAKICYYNFITFHVREVRFYDRKEN